jgi:hypothetical protein
VKGNHGTVAISSLLGMIWKPTPLELGILLLAAFHNLESIIVVVIRIY